MYMYMYVCAIERGYVLHNNTCNKFMYFKCTFNVHTYIYYASMYICTLYMYVCPGGGYYIL